MDLVRMGPKGLSGGWAEVKWQADRSDEAAGLRVLPT